MVRVSFRRERLIAAGVAFGLLLTVAATLAPTLLLYFANQKTLERWSLVGQAVTPVSVLFSGLALFAIVFTIVMQSSEIGNQREQLSVALAEQQRSSEIALRGLHADLIKMALEDPELEEVWPPIAPGVPETRKDHYCNLILNLQKVAFEAGTIDVAELRGVLAYLMRSPDVYNFWTKARSARVEVTGGDQGEDFFTAQVDEAYITAEPPAPA
jgi:hypothetical protein